MSKLPGSDIAFREEGPCATCWLNPQGFLFTEHVGFAYRIHAQRARGNCVIAVKLLFLLHSFPLLLPDAALNSRSIFVVLHLSYLHAVLSSIIEIHMT